MIDAVIGAVIMVAATSALVFAVEISESIITNAGRGPLSESERAILISAGYLDDTSLNSLQSYVQSLPQRYP